MSTRMFSLDVVVTLRNFATIQYRQRSVSRCSLCNELITPGHLSCLVLSGLGTGVTEAIATSRPVLQREDLLSSAGLTYKVSLNTPTAALNRTTHSTKAEEEEQRGTRSQQSAVGFQERGARIEEVGDGVGEWEVEKERREESSREWEGGEGRRVVGNGKEEKKVGDLSCSYRDDASLCWPELDCCVLLPSTSRRCRETFPARQHARSISHRPDLFPAVTDGYPLKLLADPSAGSGGEEASHPFAGCTRLCASFQASCSLLNRRVTKQATGAELEGGAEGARGGQTPLSRQGLKQPPGLMLVLEDVSGGQRREAALEQDPVMAEEAQRRSLNLEAISALHERRRRSSQELVQEFDKGWPDTAQSLAAGGACRVATSCEQLESPRRRK
eukprot:766730-Hanusia_phi.AAC.6